MIAGTYLTAPHSAINGFWVGITPGRHLSGQNAETPLSGRLFEKGHQRESVTTDGPGPERQPITLTAAATATMARPVGAVAVLLALTMSCLLAMHAPAVAQTPEEQCQHLEPDNRAECVEGISGDDEGQSFDLEAAETVRSIMCVGTEEDLYAPSARAMNWARATPRTQRQLRQPRRWQFELAGDTITVNGRTVRPLMHNGDMAALSVVDAVSSLDDPRAQYLSPEEQRQWEGAMDFLKGLQGQVAQATGIQDRLFVVNFATSSVTLGTLANGDLVEMQALDCL